jgi:hypothetical protein
LQNEPPGDGNGAGGLRGKGRIGDNRGFPGGAVYEGLGLGLVAVGVLGDGLGDADAGDAGGRGDGGKPGRARPGFGLDEECSEGVRLMFVDFLKSNILKPNI